MRLRRVAAAAAVLALVPLSGTADQAPSGRLDARAELAAEGDEGQDWDEEVRALRRAWREAAHHSSFGHADTHGLRREAHRLAHEMRAEARHAVREARREAAGARREAHRESARARREAALARRHALREAGRARREALREWGRAHRELARELRAATRSLRDLRFDDCH